MTSATVSATDPASAMIRALPSRHHRHRSGRRDGGDGGVVGPPARGIVGDRRAGRVANVGRVRDLLPGPRERVGRRNHGDALRIVPHLHERARPDRPLESVDRRDAVPDRRDDPGVVHTRDGRVAAFPERRDAIDRHVVRVERGGVDEDLLAECPGTSPRMASEEIGTAVARPSPSRALCRWQRSPGRPSRPSREPSGGHSPRRPCSCRATATPPAHRPPCRQRLTGSRGWSPCHRRS